MKGELYLFPANTFLIPTNRGRLCGLVISILHNIIGYHGGMIDFESRLDYA